MDKLEGGERGKWETLVGTEDGFKTRKDALYSYSLGSGTLDQQKDSALRRFLSCYLVIPSQFYFRSRFRFREYFERCRLALEPRLNDWTAFMWGESIY